MRACFKRQSVWVRELTQSKYNLSPHPLPPKMQLLETGKGRSGNGLSQPCPVQQVEKELEAVGSQHSVLQCHKKILSASLVVWEFVLHLSHHFQLHLLHSSCYLVFFQLFARCKTGNELIKVKQGAAECSSCLTGCGTPEGRGNKSIRNAWNCSSAGTGLAI